MRAFLDANVLFPTVLREVLTEAASLYHPLWSNDVLEEWRRAVALKLGPVAAEIANAEIAMLTRRFPDATVRGDDPVRLAMLETMQLPDEYDRHVIAAAICGAADVIVTQNRRDFPRRAMAALNITVLSADEFVAQLLLCDRAAVLAVAQRVFERAKAAGSTMERRALLRRAQLPRLGRALEG